MPRLKASVSAVQACGSEIKFVYDDVCMHGTALAWCGNLSCLRSKLLVQGVGVHVSADEECADKMEKGYGEGGGGWLDEGMVVGAPRRGRS